ncbi:MAG: PilZ domain-containing protein, partial [Acidobacteria bacterium]|nr:PilZ domain-containing protein [Acidobacteriota bacterium]
MKFHALMVSLDDAAAGMLAQIFDDLLLDHERCSLSEAQSKFDGKRIDLLALHFDDVSVGESLIAALRRSSMSKTAIALGLVSDPSKVTGAFGGGANFVLYQPLCADNARASLRAAAALLQRERRRQFRVPVQLAVSLTSEGVSDLEGIMLDLSEGGMDVLAAQALQRGQMMEVNFRLPPATDIVTRTQVVWANANGQSGLQFVNLSEAQSRQLSCWLGTNAPQSPPDDPEPLSEYTLSDLSLGGCYIETLAPFPKSTRIDICFRVSEFEIHLDGTVRLVYPSHGMGVEFTANPEQKELVSSLIDRLSGHPGVKPDVLV